MEEQFYSFDEVLKALQIEREELEGMIHEGEISAHAEGGKVKFRKSDINILRISKMDQPTISIHEHDDLDVIEEISDVELVDDSSAWQPLLAMDRGQEDEEVEPLLDITPEENPAQPLLNISSHDLMADEEPVESKYEISRVDMEDLVFEKNNFDEMQDTGELLFDSKDQKHATANEVNNLFKSSEIEYGIEDSEATAIKESLDLAEDEHAVISTVPPFIESLSIEESKKRQQVKTFASVAAVLLAFVILACVIIFASQSKRIEVTVHPVAEIEIPRYHNIRCQLHPEKTVVIPSQYAGELQKIANQGTWINQGALVAAIVHPPHLVAKVSQAQKQLAQKQHDFNLLKANFTTLIQQRNQFLKDNREKVPDLKAMIGFYRRYRSQKNPDDLEKYRAARQRLSADFLRSYSDFSRKGRNLIGQKKQYEKELQELQSQLQNHQQQLQNYRQPIVAPHAGIIKKWHVQDQEQVDSGRKLCDLDLVASLTAKVEISVHDALTWKAGDQVKIFHNDKAYNATVTGAESQQQVVQLAISLPNPENRLQPETTVELRYQKNYRTLGIPEKAIVNKADGYFVLLAQNNMVVKKKIELGERLGNFVAIKGNFLQKGDRVIIPGPEDLKDGDAILIGKDNGGGINEK